GGVVLPQYLGGPQSQAWWAMVVLMLVSGSLYGGLVFSYLFLWTAAPGFRLPEVPPSLAYPAVAAAMLVASSAIVRWSESRLESGRGTWPMLAAVVLLVGAWVTSLAAQWDVPAAENGYGAIVH